MSVIADTHPPLQRHAHSCNDTCNDPAMRLQRNCNDSEQIPTGTSPTAGPRTTLAKLASEKPREPLVTPRSPARKAFTILGSLAVAGVVLWFGTQVVLISGTKASFTFVSVSAPPAGGSGGPVRTTTTTTRTTTTSTTTTTPPPAAGGR